MEGANALEVTRRPRQRSALQPIGAHIGAAIAAVFALLGLGSCGSGGGFVAPQIVTQILSNFRFDGDIEQTSPTSFIVTQGMSPSIQTVVAGIDPSSGHEFRAFLNFPLTGTTGVPGNAIIDSAFLEVLVDNLIPANGSLPLRIELVAFQPPTLIASDFDRSFLPPLGAVLVRNVTGAHIGNYLAVDVTSLMIVAQQRGLLDFQVRIMQDLGPPIFTVMVIDDTIAADRALRAPLLTVTYH